MKIYLARHALTDAHAKRTVLSWTPGIGLNNEGKEQARALASALKHVTFTHIISSPIQRAYETALVVAETKNMDVEIDPSFSEWYMGVWTGLNFDSVRDTYPDAFKVWRSEPHRLEVPGGERLSDVADRMFRGLQRWAGSRSFPQSEGENGNSLLIVSHKDPIRALLTRIVNTELKNMKKFDLGLASVTKISHEPGAEEPFVIELLNFVPWDSI